MNSNVLRKPYHNLRTKGTIEEARTILHNERTNKGRMEFQYFKTWILEKNISKFQYFEIWIFEKDISKFQYFKAWIVEKIFQKSIIEFSLILLKFFEIYLILPSSIFGKSRTPSTRFHS